MLTQIYVKDFILLDEVNLSLNENLSAFTGETGAGKSLLMDAIGILKGDRIRSSMVKTGKDKAIIEGVFDVTCNKKVQDILLNAGYDIDENQIIVTREFTKEGKSSTRLNQRMISVSFLREVMSELIDLHSQHDTQYLLNPKYHLSLLDQFIQEDTLIKNVKDTYKIYKKYRDEYNHLLHAEYNEDDLEFLTFQLNEIDEANIQEDELEQLEEEIKKMSNFEKVSTTIASTIEMLDGEQGCLTTIYEATHNLSSLQYDDELENYASKLNDLFYSLEDVISDVKNYAQTLEFDEQEYQRVMDRISLIHKIYRKYGGKYSAIVHKRDELEQTIDSILHRQDALNKLIKQWESAKKEYMKNAKQLHDVRLKKAKELEDYVMKQLHDLELPNAKFHINFNEIEPCGTGIDQVEFLISMNKGEQLKSLSNTASGGELSRFMLGMKTVFAHLEGIETIIFDEIDTGVSGNVAFAIGKKMQELAQQVQVFCVTHLAPVAACAKYHYVVKKEQNDNNTKTNIHLLDNDEQIQELAMISSGSDSDSAKTMAQELLNKAKR